VARVGIGVDMLEIARMERALKRHPSFAARVFTDDERAYCDSTARPAEHYAARFAAREAVVKALGTGFSGGIGMRDVSVGRDVRGRPVAILSGRAAEAAHERGVDEVVLSLSRTHDVAVANAVAMTDDVRPHADEGPDPKKEFQASFREAKSIIDELERLQDGIMDTLGDDGPAEPREDELPLEGSMGE